MHNLSEWGIVVFYKQLIDYFGEDCEVKREDRRDATTRIIWVPAQCWCVLKVKESGSEILRDRALVAIAISTDVNTPALSLPAARSAELLCKSHASPPFVPSAFSICYSTPL